MTAAVFLPVVLFLIPLTDIVSANSKELRYEPSLMRGFLSAGLVTWLAGFWIVGRFRGRILARLWLTLPWAVLLLDVIGAALERRSVDLTLSGGVDALVVLLVVAAALAVPWPRLQTLAAVVGVALLVQGAYAHTAFVRRLSRDDILGGNRAASVPAPAANAPGNVYHILLDNYLGESFAYSTGADATRRYPGFTYYSRFNTNFPRTESSEPAMIDGRLPQPGMSVGQWPARALREGFWKDLAAANVGVWVYPYGRWLCPDYAVQCLASSDIEGDAQADVTRDTTIDLWALRLFPASVRRALNARAASSRGAAPEATAGFSVTSAIGASFAGGSRRSTTLSALPAQYFNIKLFDEMLADETRRPARGQYVYYHALLPHPPYIVNERCEYVANPTAAASFYWPHVACANLLIERLVSELARLGRLDDSLIIVHADHGDMEFLLDAKLPGRGLDFALDPGARRYQQPDTTYADDYSKFVQLNDGDPTAWRSMAVEVFSSGLLLAKFPRSTTYAEDTRPVQLLDIGPTVLAHFGAPIASSYAGTPIPRVQSPRDSVFFAHDRTFKGGLAKYELTGQGWTLVSQIPVEP